MIEPFKGGTTGGYSCLPDLVKKPSHPLRLQLHAVIEILAGLFFIERLQFDVQFLNVC